MICSLCNKELTEDVRRVNNRNSYMYVHSKCYRKILPKYKSTYGKYAKMWFEAPYYRKSYQPKE